jgi:hypothetical protein
VKMSWSKYPNAHQTLSLTKSKLGDKLIPNGNQETTRSRYQRAKTIIQYEKIQCSNTIDLTQIQK